MKIVMISLVLVAALMGYMVISRKKSKIEPQQPPVNPIADPNVYPFGADISGADVVEPVVEKKPTRKKQQPVK
jgi:hypothetical protein